MTAGVASNMAIGGVAELSKGKWPVPRNLLMTPRNIGRIADELAKMRGAAMKIGQLVSMDTGDVLPPELAQVMGRLRNDAHFMPPKQLKAVLNAHWPNKWLGQFRHFDVRPLAAASIGQVHRAQLQDGRDLAIKVQYPGVAQSIDSDVANVGALLRMSGLLPNGFDIAPYLKAAREQLHEETDYGREGAFLAEFSSLLADDPRFALPEVQSDWTTDCILAMTYVAGDPIEDLHNAPKKLRDQVAQDLIDLLMRELCVFGTMQTDPNFANYRYNHDTGQIVLLDFGATRKIDPQVISDYLALMQAGLAKDGAKVDEAVRRIGFYDDTCETKHRDLIHRMIMTVFVAIQDGFDFSDTSLSQKLQVDGMVLSDEGFVPPPLPIDALYLQRKFAGTFLLANRLRAQVDLRTLLRRYI